MGNLRDQLKKANLISKKDAKRLAHEERVHKSKVGGDKGVDAERAAHEAKLREQREEQKAVDRTHQEGVQRAREAAAERAACEALLQREVRRPDRSGASRWYFELPDGTLPCLDLPASDRMQLQEGMLAVVRCGPAGSHSYGLLERVHADRVGKQFADRVVWVAGTPVRAAAAGGSV